MLELVFELR